MIKDFLRNVPLFEELPEKELEQVCAASRRIQLNAGELLFAEGDTGKAAYVIEKGGLEIFKGTSPNEVLLAQRTPGEVIGEMALLEDSPRMSSVRASAATTLIEIKKDQIDTLLRTSLGATVALFNTVLTRWRSTESLLRQTEKMAQLGTLTAGVAHELNNPASAMQRAAEQLTGAFSQFHPIIDRMNRHQFNEQQWAEIRRLRAQARENAQMPPELDTLTRADLEATLEGVLDNIGLEEPWRFTSVLVDLGMNEDDLVGLAEMFEHESLTDTIDYISKAYQVPALLREITSAAARISAIVKSLKSYTYLDQGPTQEVDIHQGIKDTLVMLSSKIGPGIQLHTEFSEDVPKIHAYGSELNQVWTNLIDNALDAVGEEGKISVRTERVGDFVDVAIEDNGPGIPEEIQDRVMDAFFTTKPPGSGTGLGLDISYNIVVHKHKGSFTFTSRPGQTIFKVQLPL